MAFLTYGELLAALAADYKADCEKWAKLYAQSAMSYNQKVLQPLPETVFYLLPPDYNPHPEIDGYWE